jgi:hypothetical protein
MASEPSQQMVYGEFIRPFEIFAGMKGWRVIA